MHAEIIAIGTELLLGEITDTNSAYIARALRAIGLDLRWISAVGDNATRIAEAVDCARQRSAVVITTGGLGPTVDDPTRTAIAAACQRPLEYRPDLWDQVLTRYARWGHRPTENNRRQAYVPAGAIALENPVGTAPCFMVELPESVIIALPGVPREMEHMLDHAVLPYLRTRFNLHGVITAKVLRVAGLGESQIDEMVGELEKLANPTVGLAAHSGQTDVRLTAKAESEAEAEALLAPLEAQIRALLGTAIYGEGKETLEEVVGRQLAARAQTIAVAEAGTGGQIAARLAALPASPDVFRGGQLAAPHPALSAEEMARTIRRTQAADWGLALVLTPHGQGGWQAQIALAHAAGAQTHRLGYGGPPASAPLWASTQALNWLRLKLLEAQP